MRHLGNVSRGKSQLPLPADSGSGLTVDEKVNCIDSLGFHRLADILDPSSTVCS